MAIQQSSNLVKTSFIIFSIIFSITILTYLILINSSVSATTVSDAASATASVNVSSACSLSGGGNNYSGTISPGTTTEFGASGTAIKATCNDPLGFSIYAIGYGNNTYGNNQLTSTNGTIGTDPSGTNSYWVFKLSAVSGTYTPIIAGSSNDPEKSAEDPDYSSYQSVPATFAKVAYRTTHTDIDDPSTSTTATGSSINAMYKVYISPSQPADTYTGAVKYTLVHPHNTTPPVASDCNPNGTTIATGSGTDIKCMQDISSTNKASILANMITDKQYQLVDIRDNKEYWIAKLEDGNIWMTQNLDLDLDTSKTLTSNDTDLRSSGSAGYVTGYSESDGVISWTPSVSTVKAITTESTNLDSFTWPNNYYTMVSMDPGDWYWSGTYYDSSTYCPSVSTTNPNYIGCDYISKRTKDKNGTSVTNNWATYFKTSPFTGTGTSNNDTHGHVGNYYNWSAAIASSDSTNGYPNATDTDATLINSPTNSICPKGWRLPTATKYTAGSEVPANNEFYKLNALYNSGLTNTDEGLIGAPTYFVRGGSVWSSYLHYAGYSGYYWSSSVSSSSKAHLLDFFSGAVNPQRTVNRTDGISVRCVAGS